MPKKGSRKVQFEIKGFTVDQTEDGGWLMRVVQEGLLDGLSDVAGAIEEAKAQAPNVVVSSATVKEIATGTVEPGQTGTVPQDTGGVECPGCGVPHLSGHRDSCACDHCGTTPQDMSDPSLGSSGNLPFPPERKTKPTVAPGPYPVDDLPPDWERKPDTKAVIKRVRETKGGEK